MELVAPADATDEGRDSRKPHDPIGISRFRTGVEAFVLAYDVELERHVYFPEHVPVAKRSQFVQRTRQSFRCPVSECSSSLSAVFREPRARNGFRHPMGVVEHAAPEDLWHGWAQGEIRAWAERKYGSTVKAEIERPTRDGRRRLDVLLTSRHSGERVAVEVQYAAMTSTEWRQRQADHDADGILAVSWLLGHARTNFNMREGRLRRNQLARTMVEHGTVPMWINPTTRQVLTAWTEGTDGTPRAPQPGTHLQVDIVDLDDCTLTARGIESPMLTQILDIAQERERVSLERAERMKLEKERREAEQRDEDRRRAEAAKEARRRRRRRWDSSAAALWLREQDRQPVAIFETRPGDEQFAELIGLAPEHWKAIVYRRIVESPHEISWRGREGICAALNASMGRKVEFDDAGWEALKLFIRRLTGENAIRTRWHPQKRMLLARSLTVEAVQLLPPTAGTAEPASRPGTPVAGPHPIESDQDAIPGEPAPAPPPPPPAPEQSPTQMRAAPPTVPRKRRWYERLLRRT
jgi:hypothetical protein